MMNILIADFDRKFVEELQRNWSVAGTNLLVCSDDKTLMPLIKKTSIDLAFIEVPFLMLDNMDLISYLKERQPGIEIFVLCDDRNWQGAASAITRGASSFLKKPVTLSLLESTTSKIQAQQQNKSNTQLMESQVLDSLLGDTPEMRKILKTVYKVAPTNSTLLITGESGSGKEFLANVVHRYSKRANEPFVPVNCGAIPENLVESELFGSKKGSYTGSTADKKGLFESANGGTLFLDEVGELSLATQVKLLRFLQSHEIRRVGETDARYLDIRIIAATNRDLQQAMHEGRFREDLYYRLNTFHLQLPPLRDRKPVIPNLIRYFILKNKEAQGKEIHDLEPAALEYVQVEAREKTVAIPHIKDAASLKESASEPVFDNAEDAEENEKSVENPLGKPIHFEPISGKTDRAGLLTHNPTKFITHNPAPEEEEILSLDEMERRHILHALSICKGNKTEVCKKLGISRATLWRKLKELKIEMDGGED